MLYSTEDVTTRRSDTVHRSVLGTPTASNPVVFHEAGKRYAMELSRTRDRKMSRWAVKAIPSEFKTLPVDQPNGQCVMIEPRREGIRYFAGSRAALSAASGHHFRQVHRRARGILANLLTAAKAIADQQICRSCIAYRRQ